LVPTLVIELYKFYILLYESPRHQAIGSISTGGPAIFPIHFIHPVRLIRHVRDFWYRGLHPESHFVLGNAGADFRIAVGVLLYRIQLLEVVQHLPSILSVIVFGIA